MLLNILQIKYKISGFKYHLKEQTKNLVDLEINIIAANNGECLAGRRARLENV